MWHVNGDGLLTHVACSIAPALASFSSTVLFHLGRSSASVCVQLKPVCPAHSPEHTYDTVLQISLEAIPLASRSIAAKLLTPLVASHPHTLSPSIYFKLP